MVKRKKNNSLLTSDRLSLDEDQPNKLLIDLHHPFYI